MPNIMIPDEHWSDTEMLANWRSDLVRDIGMVGRKRTIRKSVLSEGSVNAVVKEEKSLNKEITQLKKVISKQALFFDELQPMVNGLQEILEDSLRRMDNETVDDVFSIGHVRDEINKLASSLIKMKVVSTPESKDSIG